MALPLNVKSPRTVDDSDVGLPTAVDTAEGEVEVEGEVGATGLIEAVAGVAAASPTGSPGRAISRPIVEELQALTTAISRARARRGFRSRALDPMGRER